MLPNQIVFYKKLVAKALIVLSTVIPWRLLDVKAKVNGGYLHSFRSIISVYSVRRKIP